MTSKQRGRERAVKRLTTAARWREREREGGKEGEGETGAEGEVEKGECKRVEKERWKGRSKKGDE